MAQKRSKIKLALDKGIVFQNEFGVWFRLCPKCQKPIRCISRVAAGHGFYIHRQCKECSKNERTLYKTEAERYAAQLGYSRKWRKKNNQYFRNYYRNNVEKFRAANLRFRINKNNKKNKETTL